MKVKTTHPGTIDFLLVLNTVRESFLIPFNILSLYKERAMKLTKQILLPTMLVALTACTTVATSQPETVYVEEEIMVEEDFFSQAELDQMLAPIALYPDVLLSQVLMAATYPLEIVEASRWSKVNTGLEGDEAVLAVENLNWDISVKTLVAFPDLIQLMDENLTWTRQLGDAFLMQESQVMDTIQLLRQRSLDAGNLASLEHVRVEQQEEVIIIEPADIQVVYVPYYRPTIVYGDWWWYDYPPYYWDPPMRYYTGVGFHWGHGFHYSTGFHISTRFYFSFCDWHRRSIVVHHNYHRYGRHDWDRIRHRPRPVHDVQVWKHNPHHRRGVDYRSDRLQGELPRHGSSGKSSKPILARPSRNKDDRQNSIDPNRLDRPPDTRRGTSQASTSRQETTRIERPERPGKGGRDTGSVGSRSVSSTSNETTVAANRSQRVSPTTKSSGTTRPTPSVSRTQSTRTNSPDRTSKPANSPTVSKSSGITKAPTISRSSQTTRSAPKTRTSTTSPTSRSGTITRSTPNSRPSSVTRSTPSSRPSSVSRSSSTRTSPQARSSSSRSASSAPKARAPSSSRSSGYSSSNRSYSSSRSSSPPSRASSSSRSSGSYSRPSSPPSSNSSSSSATRSSPTSAGSRRS